LSFDQVLLGETLRFLAQMARQMIGANLKRKNAKFTHNCSVLQRAMVKKHANVCGV